MTDLYRKREVDYRRGMRDGDRCGICLHFRNGPFANLGRCLKVEGDIEPEYWCNLFQRGRQES